MAIRKSKALKSSKESGPLPASSKAAAASGEEGEAPGEDALLAEMQELRNIMDAKKRRMKKAVSKRRDKVMVVIYAAACTSMRR